VGREADAAHARPRRLGPPHLGDRARSRARAIGAQLLDVVEALAADGLRLRARDHKLAARDAAAAALHRLRAALVLRLGVDRLHRPGAARQLPHADRPGGRRQPLLVGAEAIRPGPLSP
jgi:hypothetical protein